MSSDLSLETVMVDLGTEVGELRHCACGFLHGFGIDGTVPADEMVVPLNIRLHRTNPCATWLQAERLRAFGIRQQVVISDGWAYNPEADWPGDEGDWVKWEWFVRGLVLDAARRGLRPQWDIWNEADDKDFWTRSPEQFDTAWVRAVHAIREIDPDAEIVGPSFTHVHPRDQRFDDFLRMCHHNNALPDYICWHFPRDLIEEVRYLRSFLDREQIDVKRIMVNEYCMHADQTAGKTAWWVAQLERAGVDMACHAIWPEDEGTGNLNGTIHDPARSIPRGQWWVYRRYGEITGRALATKPSDCIEVIAGYDAQVGTVRVLLGNVGRVAGAITVRFTATDRIPYIGINGSAHVVVERIPEATRGPVVCSDTVFAVDAPASDGQLEVVIPWHNAADAFAIQLSPAAMT